MAVILVAIFVIGYDVMLICLGLLSLIAAFELNRALKIQWSVPAFLAYGTIIAHYVCLRFVESKYIILVYAVSLIIYLAVFVITYPKFELLEIFGSYFTIFYAGVSLSFLYLLRIHPPSGAFLVWLAVFSSWGCDIAAYLIGMKFGKHPFVPKLSPKKSIEGAVGGIIGAVLFSVIYGIIIQKYVPDIKSAPLVFGIVAIFGAAAGQIGDLAASAIKRKVGIKDYGRLIPGHGGIMDRFDAMILVAPMMYIITIYAVM